MYFMFFNKRKVGPLARLVAVIVLLCNTLGSPLVTLEAAPAEPRAPEAVSPVTFDIAQALNQLLEAVMAYQAKGSLTGGVGGSLVTKLQNAQRQLANGQTKATLNEVQAFVNEIQAQRGKKITIPAADDLLAQAQWIVARLQLPAGVSDIVPADLPIVSATVETASKNETAMVPAAGAAILFWDSRLTVVAESGTFTGSVQLRLQPGSKPDPKGPIGNPENAPLSFTLEAINLQTGQTSPLLKPVRLVIDLRRTNAAATGQSWYFASRDPNDSSLWDYLEVEAHDPDGLISAFTTHFSTWAAGSEPSGWQYHWQAPTISAFSGAIAYTYPIEVPPGRNNLQPSIDLSYSSRGLDGLVTSDAEDQGPLGLGWSINNIEITRNGVHTYCCWSTNSVLVFPDSFSLVLNGSSYALKPAGSPLSDTVRYYAENGPELFIQRRYTPNDSKLTNPGKLYWIVKTPNGTTYRLGYTSDSASGQSSGVYVLAGHKGAPGSRPGTRWRVDTVTDVYGNQIQYDYEMWSKDGAELRRISEIRYNYANRAPDANTRLTGSYASKIVLAGSGDHRIAKINLYHVDQTTPLRVIDIGLGALGHLGCFSFTQTKTINFIEQQDGRGGALPRTTFSYVTLPHFDNSCRYSYIEQVNNGYGSRAKFTYIGDGREDDWHGENLPEYGQSYFVTRVETWDGIHSLPAITHYDYLTPCYDTPKGRKMGNLPGAFDCSLTDTVPGFDGVAPYTPVGGLVGFAQTTVTTRDYGGEFLNKATSRFHQNRLLSGRAFQVQTLNPESTLLRQVETAYQIENLTGGTTFTHPRVMTTTTYDAGQANSLRLEYQYDPALQGGAQYGNLTAKIEYDENGQPYRRTLTAFSPNLSTWIVNKPVSEELDSWNSTAWSRSKLTIYRYDNHGPADTSLGTLGQPTMTRLWSLNPATGAARFIDKRSEYDAFGNPVGETVYADYGTETTYANADPRLTRTDYDSQFHLYPEQITNPIGHRLRFSYDLVRGLPLSITNANDVAVFYRYDSFGRLVKVVRPGDTEFLPTLQYFYSDGAAPFRIETRQRVTSGCATCVQRTFNFYDGEGRGVQTRAAGGGDQQTVTNTIYDALGLVRASHAPVFESFSENFVRPPGWASRPRTITDYDAIGRSIRVTNPDGTVIQTAFRGRQTGVLDATGHQRISEADLFGRVVAVREYTATVSAINFNLEAYATTRYVYDAQNNLTQITDALGHITRVTYNALGQKVSMTDPDLGQWRYTYDPAGNPQTQTDNRGVTLTLEYDRLNRLTAKRSQSPAGVAATGEAFFFYDEGGAAQQALGRRTRMVDASGETTWTYDERSRLTSETRTLAYGLGTYTLRTQYNTADQVVSQTYPDGETVTTTYDSRGLPQELSSSQGTTYANAARYDELARLTQLSFGNGLQSHSDYYAPTLQGGHLRHLQVGEALLDLNYTYDPAGNLTRLEDHSVAAGAGQSLQFAYDALNRLVQATGEGGALPGYDQRYQYDVLGRFENKITEGVGLAYHYGEEHVHAATSLGEDRYTYDANGNLAVRLEAGITYTQTWTAENKLARVAWLENGQAHTTTLLYDGDGNRILRVEREGEVEITTLYLGSGYEKQVNTTVQHLSQSLYSSKVAAAGHRIGWMRPLSPEESDGLKAPVQPALGPVDRTYTTTVFHPGTYAWVGAVVQAAPWVPSCNPQPANSLPGDICGNPPVYEIFFDEDGNVTYKDPHCDPLGQWPCQDGLRYVETQAPHTDVVVVTNPPATIVGQVTCTFGVSPWCISQATLTLTGTEPVAGYSITSIAGNRDGAAFSYPGATAVITVTENTPKTVFTYWAVSSYGDTSYPISSTIKIDTQPPATTATLTGPLGAGGWYVGPVTVSLASTDPTSGVATKRLDGTPYAGPRVYSAQGQTNFTYQSVDNAGNTEPVQTGSFKIDSIAPTNPTLITETHGIKNGSWQIAVSDSAFTWSGATDATSGLAGYFVYFGADPSGTATTFVTAPAFDPLAVSSGTYYLRVRAKDNAGNVAAWTTLFTFKYDNTPPSNPMSVVESHNAKDSVWQNSAADPAFSWSGAADAASGVGGYRVYFGSDPEGTADTFVTTAAYDPPTISSGKYYLRVQAKDNAGNTAAWATLFTFKYDNTLPSNPVSAVESHGAQDQAWQNFVADPAFSWSGAADADAGVGGYRVYFGSDPNGTADTFVTMAAYASQAVSSGTYYLRVQAEDNADNTAADWVTLFIFDYDGQAPLIGELTPTDGDLLTATTPSLGVVFSDPDLGAGIDVTRTTLSLDGQRVTLQNLNSSGLAYTPSQPLAPGQHFVTLQVSDLAGNVTRVSTTFTLDPDTWVRITSPADGAFVNQLQTTLALELENQRGMQVTVYSPVQTLTRTVEDGQLVIEPLELQPGLNRITIQVQDLAGNSASDEFTLTVDTQRSVAWVRVASSIFNPERGAAIFYVTALPGAETQVQAWELQVLESASVVLRTFSGTTSADAWPVLWDGKDMAGQIVPDGDYDYQLRLTTTDGQVIVSDPGKLQIRRQAPGAPTLVCDSDPIYFSFPPALMSGTAPEEARVLVYVDGEPTIVATVHEGRWQSAIPLVNDTLRTVTVTAMDAAGNESEASAPCRVGLTETDPFIEPHASLSADHVGLNETVSLTATTRTTGAPLAWVRAAIPSVSASLPMVSSTAGQWNALWRSPTAGAIEGIVVIAFEAKDTAHPLPNHGAQFVQPYLDLVPPFVSILSPWAGEALANRQVSVKGRSEILSSIVVTATMGTQTIVATTTSDALGDWQATLTLPDGLYTLTAQATDRGGNVGPATAPITLTVDATGPVIQAESVTPAFLQSGQSLTLTAMITDTLSVLGQVQALIGDLPQGGQTATVTLPTAGAAQYQTTVFVETGTKEGQKPITFQAQDALHNTTTLTHTGFIVDDTPPALEIPGMAITGTNLVLSGMTVYHGPNSSGQITVTLRTADESAARVTAGLNTLTFPDVFKAADGQTLTLNGAHAAADYAHTYAVGGTTSNAFTIQAQDRAGNVAVSQAFTVTYDNLAPSTQITVPATSGLRFDVAWSGRDDQAGVQTYEVEYRDGASGSWQTWSPGLRSPAKFVGQDGHTYVFRVRATDAVGNVSPWQESRPVVVSAVTKYYLFGGQRIALRQGGALFYLHGDHLGSASLVTDAGGHVVSAVRYLPYGEVRWSSDQAPTEFGFGAQRQERGFKLMDFGARFYSAPLGQFVSADSIVPNSETPQALNRYAYALGNPLRHNDPTGHGSCDPQNPRFTCRERRAVAGPRWRSPWRIPRGATPEQIAALRQNAEQAFLAEAQSPLHGDVRYLEFGGCNTQSTHCWDGLHPALDSTDYRDASNALVKVNTTGREVYATAYGKVSSVGITDAGRYVLIEHDVYGEKFYSVYVHLDTQTVKKGQMVDENTQIGTMGNTTTWPEGVAVHLHFEVRKAGNVDLTEPYGNPFYGKKWYVKDWEELHQNYVDLSSLPFAGGK